MCREYGHMYDFHYKSGDYLWCYSNAIAYLLSPQRASALSFVILAVSSAICCTTSMVHFSPSAKWFWEASMKWPDKYEPWFDPLVCQRSFNYFMVQEKVFAPWIAWPTSGPCRSSLAIETFHPWGCILLKPPTGLSSVFSHLPGLCFGPIGPISGKCHHLSNN